MEIVPRPLLSQGKTWAALDRVEWEHIGRVLADCGGNITQTARLLGLDRRTLRRKLGKYPPRH